MPSTRELMDGACVTREPVRPLSREKISAMGKTIGPNDRVPRALMTRDRRDSCAFKAADPALAAIRKDRSPTFTERWRVGIGPSPNQLTLASARRPNGARGVKTDGDFPADLPLVVRNIADRHARRKALTGR